MHRRRKARLLTTATVATTLVMAATVSAAASGTTVLPQDCHQAEGPDSSRTYIQCEGPGSSTWRPSADIPTLDALEQATGDISIQATESCIYDSTVFAFDDRSGDAKTAYSSGLSAHAAAHSARNLAQPWQTVRSHAYTTVGHAITWNGSNVRTGRVKMPWGVIGNLRTATEFSGLPPSSTSAAADVEVYIGVFNRNTGERQEALVSETDVSGNAQKEWGDRYDKPGGFWTFSVTYRPGQALEPYLRLETETEATGSLSNPALNADALSDFLGRYMEYGAELKHVEYEVDLPDGWTLNCS